jgi:hypothetical protein
VIVIEGAGHVLIPAETGCLGENNGTEYDPEYLDTMEFWLMDR